MGGFAAAIGCAPTLRHDGPDALRIEAFPHRPHSRGITPSDRTLRLFLWETKPEGLLQRASVEHGQATLMASGSTGTARDGWLDHPLSLLVRRFTGYAARSRGRTRHVRTTDDRRTKSCTLENTPGCRANHASTSGLVDWRLQKRQHMLLQDHVPVVGSQALIA